MKLYPRALENRYDRHHPAVHPARRNFLRAALLNFALLQVLFLCIFSYVFGAIFEQSLRTHNLKVLYVDYDGGIIGQAIRDAYQSLRGHNFPTLVEHPTIDYSTPNHLRHAVCSEGYWAALFSSTNASSRLEAALAGGAATAYDKSDVLTFIWNQARYPTVADSAIAWNMRILSEAARNAYVAANGTGALELLASPTAISIFTDPWHLTSDNIQPTAQDSRAIYNTLVVLLLLIQGFFFLGTINGLYVQFRIFSRIHPMRIALVRLAISFSYTFAGSLAATGTIWAFRAGWNVSAGQFYLTWMSLWLFAHANFLVLDIFTIWLPMPYIPMALITWAMINLASILVPLELAPGFYRWSYALPAHEIFEVLIDVWSRGCNPQLHHTLPVMFTYEVVGIAMSILGAWRRCHYAVVAEEVQENTLKQKVQHKLSEMRHPVLTPPGEGEKDVSESLPQGEPPQEDMPMEGQKELAGWRVRRAGRRLWGPGSIWRSACEGTREHVGPRAGRRVQHEVLQ